MVPDKRSEILALLREGTATPWAALQNLVGFGVTRQSPRRSRRAPAAALKFEEQYRYELATLLGRLAMHRMYGDPAWKGILHRSPYAGQELKVPSAEVLAACSKSAERIASVDQAAWQSVIPYTSNLGGYGALDLSLASLSLYRHDHAAIMAGLEHVKGRRWQAAWQLLDPVTVHPSSALCGSYAHEAKAFFHLARGTPTEAIDAYRAASEAEDNRPAPALAWFVLACTLGEKNQAAESDGRVRAMIDETDASVEGCISLFTRLGERGIFQASFDGISRGIRSPATERIIHELS